MGSSPCKQNPPPNDRLPACHTAPRFPPRVGAGVNNLSYNTIEKKNNTAIFNMIPCIFPAGWHPSQGQCALVLCPPRAGQSPLHTGQACAPCSGSGAQPCGLYPPALPGCGFKATGQCKLDFPGPARLPLLLVHVQECPWLCRAACAASKSASLQGAAAGVLVLQDGKLHLQKSGPDVCA